MTEDLGVKQPVRKLTVKNFSVIQDAELEFGKITVLIGPQSSGKSLLCKLAYFLSRDVLLFAVSSATSKLPFDSFQRELAKKFQQQFPTDGWLTVDFSATYSVANNWVRVGASDKTLTMSLEFDFSRQFIDTYQSMVGSQPDRDVADVSRLSIQNTWWGIFNRLFAVEAPLESFYIPAGRAFFTNATIGFTFLQNPAIDLITRNFAAQVQWDTRWKTGMLTSGRGVTDEINRSMTDIAQGFVMEDSGVPRFLTLNGQRKLPLELLSSGTQEIVPLFNVLEQFMFLREHNFELVKASNGAKQKQSPISGKPFLYLEEPEANVFPETQHQLVRLFSWLAHDSILDFHWLITTHSPYILSAFNNLIEASQVATAKPELAGEVAKLIPEKYWVKSNDFKAYCIHDGKLESIMDEETGLISGNYLDSVSETIGIEFDELLRIGYVEA